MIFLQFNRSPKHTDDTRKKLYLLFALVHNRSTLRYFAKVFALFSQKCPYFCKILHYFAKLFLLISQKKIALFHKILAQCFVNYVENILLHVHPSNVTYSYVMLETYRSIETTQEIFLRHNSMFCEITQIFCEITQIFLRNNAVFVK